MFPGAAADRERATYSIIGAPLDASTTFQPGARFGPREFRHAATSFEDYDHHTDQRFTDLAVHDHGDIRPGGDTEEYLDFLEGTVREYHADGVTPLLVGGEHTVSVPAIRAVDPDVVVTLDAHLDLRESYASNPYSHATVSHHALDVAEEIVVVGARSGSAVEWDRAQRGEVTVVEPDEVPTWEPSFENRDVYLSVDIDAFDPGFAPGTGTPEPFGLTPREGHDVVRGLAGDCVGFDVVEVNDRDDGQAATLGAKLLRAFVFAHASA